MRYARHAIAAADYCRHTHFAAAYADTPRASLRHYYVATTPPDAAAAITAMITPYYAIPDIAASAIADATYAIRHVFFRRHTIAPCFAFRAIRFRRC